jgi:hypothetical protein
MTNEKHLDILSQGISVWNTWRTEHSEETIDLREAHLGISRRRAKALLVPAYDIFEGTGQRPLLGGSGL